MPAIRLWACRAVIGTVAVLWISVTALILREPHRANAVVAPRHLRRAPIKEAVVDFRIEPLPDLTADRIANAIGDGFRTYKPAGPIVRASFGVEVTPQGEVLPQKGLPSSAIIGVRLESDDKRYVAQFSTEGFALSRLAPYESWEPLVEEARRVWDRYAQIVSPTKIIRVATRYINNLQLPVDHGAKHEQFVVKLLELPDELPQFLARFLQRYELVDPPSGARILLTLAVQDTTKPGTLPLIIDIDAFAQSAFDPKTDDAWRFLDTLRALKNQCFFGVLTEAAVRMYE